MSKERVRQLLAKTKAIEEIVTDEDHPKLPKPFIYRCAVKPYVSWDKSRIEDAFYVTLPDDFGNVIITRAPGLRRNWPLADTSLITFLEKASESMNYEYWTRLNG